MAQTHLYITQTYLQKLDFFKLVAWNFFQNQQFKITTQTFTQFQNCNPNQLNSLWQTKVASGQISLPEISSKDDFKKEIYEFYKHYPQPSLLFLGDLSLYSLPAQEGMLKLLEEPPENLQIVLSSNFSANVLGTILSRCNLYNLPSKSIFPLLDKQLLDQTKQLLPNPADTIKNLLTSKFSLPDLKNVERLHLDFWLWQLEQYAVNILLKNWQPAICNLLEKIIFSRKLNLDNCQKKFVVKNLTLI